MAAGPAALPATSDRGEHTMTDTAVKINSVRVPEGKLGVFFMGQAGAVLKAPDDELLAVDLYLSDCCERYFGFKRLMPKLIGTADVKFDYICATHAHYDHFDPDSVPALLAHGGKLYAASDCREECDRLGIKEMEELKVGTRHTAGAFTIEAVECDHGEGTPYAVGLYITCGEKSVYIAGDTCFRPDIAEKMSGYKIDLMFAPINGAYGNLDWKQGADFFAIVRPKLCVPCHYWNFAEHGGDPGKFADEMKSAHPDLPYRLMTPGEYTEI